MLVKIELEVGGRCLDCTYIIASREDLAKAMERIAAVAAVSGHRVPTLEMTDWLWQFVEQGANATIDGEGHRWTFTEGRIR